METCHVEVAQPDTPEADVDSQEEEGERTLNIKPHKHQLIERVPQVFYGTTDASFSETVVAGLQKQDGNPQLQSGKWKTTEWQ